MIQTTYTDDELFASGLKNLSGNKSFTIARHVLSTVGSVIGLLADEKPKLSDNFFSIGGDSINAVLVLAKLNEAGFKINLDKFIGASSLLDIVDEIDSGNGDKVDLMQDSFFKLRPLRHDDKDQADLFKSRQPQEGWEQCDQISPFGQTFKSLRQTLRVYLVFGKIWNQFWQQIYEF